MYTAFLQRKGGEGGLNNDLLVKKHSLSMCGELTNYPDIPMGERTLINTFKKGPKLAWQKKFILNKKVT